MSEDSYSLSAKVFHKLRQDILSGKYQANEELKEKTIGDELGVSRTPVREALRQLELEGLVSIIPNKGAYVVGVTLKDIKDIYEIRSLLEGLCAKWAAQHITNEQLAELEENVFLSEFHASKENWEQILELDNRFHELLYEASGSKELIHVLKDYHQYVQRIRRITLAHPLRVKASTEEHKLIVESLKHHDAASAQHNAKLHIRNTMANMDKLGWENLMR
jgi:DNA-binding GntR family transcriptional regulator